jgi:hypothetical protein
MISTPGRPKMAANNPSGMAYPPGLLEMADITINTIVNDIAAGRTEL